MMSNLFSMFDPISNFNMSLNWITPILLLLILPTCYWFGPGCLMLIFNKVNSILHKEYSIILTTTKSNMLTFMFMTTFMVIVLNNFMGLFPYIFTSTVHLVFNLTVAFPIWIALMLYGWLKNTYHMFKHLVPQGTPIFLIPFMVLIETMSNFIRPITLTVRLTANMIAGHLLLTLLSSLGSTLTSMYLPILMLVQMALLTLEVAVSIIQSYVFAVLITLYTSEI